MIISGASSTSTGIGTSTLLKQLEANGLSADKAKLVQTDLAAATSASTTSSGLSLQGGSVRAALDQRIAADVSAGKLSASDAAAVKKTLDQVDGQSGASDSATMSAAASTTAQSSASGKSGGGGGGSAAKTVLSQAITVVGSTKTTVTTYTDNSTATTTATASSADQLRYGKVKPGATDPGSATARQYLSTIQPGTLIDQTA